MRKRLSDPAVLTLIVAITGVAAAARAVAQPAIRARSCSTAPIIRLGSDVPRFVTHVRRGVVDDPRA
jgi:hypothetical protein